MDLGLTGKVVVVTGGTRGIGRAIALSLAAEGARVVACARTREALDELRPRLPGGSTVCADVTSTDGPAQVLAAARSLGPPWGLVNNVGGSAARHFDQADEGDFRIVMERNLFAALRLSQALLPDMKAAGGGAIVTISSIWGREAGGGPSYNVAKAAEISLGKAMARDLAKDGIRVNTVAPGSILFPGGGWDRRMKTDPDGIADFVRNELPFGRMGMPEEVAAAVTFLLSPRASWISGACLPVDGAQGRSF